MLILAFESSCDDRAVAVVPDGAEVLSSVRESQVADHSHFGGVVPEIAARLHAEAWKPVLDQALDQAGVVMEQIDLIAKLLPQIMGDAAAQRAVTSGG